MMLEEAYKLVLEDMTKDRKENLFFRGIHSGKNDDFMFGIQEVMMHIAKKANDLEFEEMFVENAINCSMDI